MSSEAPNPLDDHRRQWQDMRYVYPVVSRRARGLSIGVNLNIDKRCNFACAYCQINRRLRRKPIDIDCDILRQELQAVLAEAVSGAIWLGDRFRDTPEPMRRLNDIAFSGDGEPTCLPTFDEAVAAACRAVEDLACETPVKIVVITNGTQLQSPQVQRALPLLDEHNGEIWAKLDAGTEEYFRRVNHPLPGIELADILDNILAVGVARDIVIQTLFMEMEGQGPAAEEVDAYIARLRWLLGHNVRIRLVQLHTVARPPATDVHCLSEAALNEIADHVRAGIEGRAPVDVYPGRDVSPQSEG